MSNAHFSPIYVTRDLVETKYRDKGVEVIFLGGSVMRGEAGSTSDIDLVVVLPQVEQAYRESFYHMGWPVEASVHDPQTLEYFFFDVDRVAGLSGLAELVAEGLEIPGVSVTSQKLKALAQNVLDMGPPVWSEDEIRRRRYQLSELVDDVRDHRSREELHAISSSLYIQLADYFLRTHQQYSGSGKTILKRIKKIDPVIYRKFTNAFDQVLRWGQKDALIELAQDILVPRGGFLFDGYRQEAPAHWRTDGDSR